MDHLSDVELVVLVLVGSALGYAFVVEPLYVAARRKFHCWRVRPELERARRQPPVVPVVRPFVAPLDSRRPPAPAVRGVRRVDPWLADSSSLADDVASTLRR